jgi:hypothetical protein
MHEIQSQVVSLLANDRERAIVRFTSELLESCTASEETYQSSL